MLLLITLHFIFSPILWPLPKGFNFSPRSFAAFQFRQKIIIDNNFPFYFNYILNVKGILLNTKYIFDNYFKINKSITIISELIFFLERRGFFNVGTPLWRIFYHSLRKQQQNTCLMVPLHGSCFHLYFWFSSGLWLFCPLVRLMLSDLFFRHFL